MRSSHEVFKALSQEVEQLWCSQNIALALRIFNEPRTCINRLATKLHDA